MNTAIFIMATYFIVAMVIYIILTGGQKASNGIESAFYMLFFLIAASWPISLPILFIWWIQSLVSNKFK